MILTARRMLDQDIARFRAQAEECQLRAERSIRATYRNAWPRMAGEWIKLVQDAERRRRLCVDETTEAKQRGPQSSSSVQFSQPWKIESKNADGRGHQQRARVSP